MILQYCSYNEHQKDMLVTAYIYASGDKYSWNLWLYYPKDNARNSSKQNVMGTIAILTKCLLAETSLSGAVRMHHPQYTKSWPRSRGHFQKGFVWPSSSTLCIERLSKGMLVVVLSTEWDFPIAQCPCHMTSKMNGERNVMDVSFPLTDFTLGLWTPSCSHYFVVVVGS